MPLIEAASQIKVYAKLAFVYRARLRGSTTRCLTVAVVKLVVMTAIIGVNVAAGLAADDVAHIAFVGTTAQSTANRGVSAFWERLRELGWTEGRNLVIEQRWADGKSELLPRLITEVLEHKVDVLVTYGTPAGVAAMKATKTVPIVVAGMGDPVGNRLAASLARPGGNLTGLSLSFSEGLPGKWLEMLQEVVPHLSSIAVISNLDSPLIKRLRGELERSAQRRALNLQFVNVRRAEDLEDAFKDARRRSQAVLVFSDATTVHNRNEVVALAAKHRLPDIYYMHEFVEIGGLMSYGPDLVLLFRRAADYVDKILKGANPADLPIEEPTQQLLTVNLKTAKALGITIPESILLRADEVIK